MNQLVSTGIAVLLLSATAIAGASGDALERLPQEAAYESIRESRGLVFLDVYAEW